MGNPFARGDSVPEKISGWDLLKSQSNVTQEILQDVCDGSGTEESPYRVEWLKNDPVNPLNYPAWKKWSITLIMALSTLCITFSSSGLAGADPQLKEYFNASQLLVTADVSLFVLAFAVGPAIWAPLSELYGRQIVFIVSFAGVAMFSGAAIASPNIGALLVLRFISGAFGASTLTNAAGVISDLFVPRERGLAGITYVAAPFLGPTLGPITCSFLAEATGWRPVASLITALALLCWLLGCLMVPETYAPVLLRRRAARLSQLTGRVYKSRVESEKAPVSAAALVRVTMTRPWVLLVREPIVLSLSIYMAIIYGTLYLSFAAFPIVFAGDRQWSQGLSGLSLLGIMVGEILGILYAVLDTIRYKKVADRSPGGVAPPEAWLPPSLVGAVALPAGLFWFAWTNGRELHWIICLIGIVPFGFGEVLVFLSVNQYLIDAYGVYAASCLATIAIVRALFGAAFPLFTTPMYEALGIHWASSVPAFCALACLPFPFLFYRYGYAIRKRCHYSAEAMRLQEQIRGTAGTSTAVA